MPPVDDYVDRPLDCNELLIEHPAISAMWGDFVFSYARNTEVGMSLSLIDRLQAITGEHGFTEIGLACAEAADVILECEKREEEIIEHACEQIEEGLLMICRLQNFIRDEIGRKTPGDRIGEETIRIARDLAPLPRDETPSWPTLL